jgi:uncharacterized membrane protein YkvI
MAAMLVPPTGAFATVVETRIRRCRRWCGQRWGVGGYYLSIAALFLAVVTTLSAALSSLGAGLEEMGLGSRRAIFFASAAALMLSMAGLTVLVGVGYPAVGFVCALMLLLLISYL